MSTRNLFYYKMQQGRRVRWKLVLDAQNLWISEGPADEVVSQLPLLTLQPETPRNTAYLEEMKRRGHSLSIADGVVDIQRVPDLEIHIARFFVQNTPCFFPGCQELRQRWQEFLTPHLGEANECPDCVLGGLMNQFREHQNLETILRKWLDGQPKI